MNSDELRLAESAYKMFWRDKAPQSFDDLTVDEQEKFLVIYKYREKRNQVPDGEGFVPNKAFSHSKLWG